MITETFTYDEISHILSIYTNEHTHEVTKRLFINDLNNNLCDIKSTTSFNKLVSDLLNINENNKNFLEVFITSSGGKVYSMQNLIYAIQKYKNKKVTNIGTASSACASLFLCFKDKNTRYVLQTSTMLLHSVQIYLGYVNSKEGKQLLEKNYDVYKEIDVLCMEYLNKKEKQMYLKGEDVILTAEEQLSRGIAHYIIDLDGKTYDSVEWLLRKENHV